MKKYYRIWIDHNGPIPKDFEGRTFEIHHKDGRPTHNMISNLQCVSIREHYWIHWFQHDWGACQAIAIRMKKSSTEISELARLAMLQKVKEGKHQFLGGEISKAITKKRLENGTHNFLGPDHNKKRVDDGTHNFLDKEKARERAQKRLASGNHPFLNGEMAKKREKQRLANGTHNFLNSEFQRNVQLERVKKGTHPSQQIHVCPKCGKIGKGGSMKRWHFDNCKNYAESVTAFGEVLVQ